MKKFCFLLQARKDDEYFSSLETEDSDCIILFFKQEVPSRKNSIFRPNTSWSQGRNILLKEAFKTQKKYEYYVFMDDDIRIFNKSSNEDGIQLYKEMLLEYRPAIGFPDYFWHLQGGSENKRFNTKQTRKSDMNSPMFFDACVNAFHESIIKEILPYQEKFDSINWWLSQEIMNHYISNFIDNSVLQFNNIISINTLSEPYPRTLGTGILNKGAEYVKKHLVNDKEFALYPKNRLLEYKNSFLSAKEMNFSKHNLYIEDSDFENFRKEFWANLGYKK